MAWLTPQVITTVATIGLAVVAIITIFWKVATKSQVKSLKTDTERDLTNLKTDLETKIRSLEDKIKEDRREVRQDLREVRENLTEHFIDHSNLTSGRNVTRPDGGSLESLEQSKESLEGDLPPYEYDDRTQS